MQILNLLGFKKPQTKKVKTLIFRKQYLTKSFFILLFIASFLCVQELAGLPGATSLSVVAQTPAAVTNTPNTANPENLVEEARELYKAGRFTEAQNLLQQAVSAFTTGQDVLKQAIALDLQGQVYLAQGQSEAAAKSFSAAATAYERGRDKTGMIKSQINQAQALRNAGSYRRALDVLEQLNDNLPAKVYPQLKAIALRSLGITQRLIGNLDKSKENIEESLKIAETLTSPAREENESAAYLMLGNIAKDRGNNTKKRNKSSEAQMSSQEVIACNEKPKETTTEKPTETGTEKPTETAPKERNAGSYFQEAIACYKQAAEKAKTPTAIIEAQLNQLSTFRDSGQPFTDTERELLRQVRETIDKLPLSRTAVQARINWARMVTERKDEAKVSDQDIAQQLKIALEDAKKLRDYRSQSYALGQLGELAFHQTPGQLPQAQDYTMQALQVAQSIGAGDIAYRWQWQLGKILIAKGGEKDREGALAAYGAAVNNLESIRGDLVTVNPDVQFSFRENVEPVYREYAGLLLKSNSQEDLKQARKAIESLQQAELVDFFRQNCITSKSQSVDELLAEADKNAALIYPIVLQNSLEVLVTLPGGQVKHQTISQPGVDIENTFTRLRNVIVPQGGRGVDVESIFTRLRNALLPQGDRGGGAEPRIIPQDKADRNYLELARQIYDWLIRPFEADFQASGVKRLVFVLDAPLLNLPLSVLYDGNKFLVENYAIAQTPGLQLLDSKPLVRGKMTALKAGLSESTQDFPPLDEVKRELNGIQSEVSGQLILNKEFTTAKIQQAITSVRYPIVHLATHGNFSSNDEETFILTWDNRLNINQLNELLRGREESGRNAIELLVLSACKTATGDKRAALGLAGVAVKAGARSTLATLWQVNDESTAKLMIKFYEKLKDTQVSKAEALQSAQLWLMQAESGKYKSPYYWAPFVLVGNWL